MSKRKDEKADKIAEPKPGKIAEAQAAVDSIVAEIDGMRQRLVGLRAELMRIGGDDTDPDKLQRAAALKEAMSNLESQLPKRQWDETDLLPLVQLRLQQAERRLEEVRTERYNLSLRLAELEILESELGDGLPGIESSLAGLADLFQRIGQHPPGFDDRRWRGLVVWARNLRQQVESIPGLRIRLAEYGDDPLYEKPWDLWSESERAWHAIHKLESDRFDALLRRTRSQLEQWDAGQRQHERYQRLQSLYRQLTDVAEGRAVFAYY